MWLGVLQVFGRELVLLQAKQDDLTREEDYLWRRTRGVIGSLTQLFIQATAEAIDTGAERITRKVLEGEGIDIGYAAEVGAGRQQPQGQAARGACRSGSRRSTGRACPAMSSATGTPSARRRATLRERSGLIAVPGASRLPGATASHK